MIDRTQVVSRRPHLVRVTQRDGDGETHLECRFSDGQKFAAVTVDHILPQGVVDEIHAVLEAHARRAT